ncbi:hypothetical protein DSO57_1029180 [Entomophthora muscae]|uniref:Uncharacterized protein n=1 Tax=Entomophthora muscae TaxID=34485 RepID=A0ACC2TNF8_9FUNG|nr:hypothetical protein DSO57_1029180 [Entomophthora muscae]
MQFYKQTIVVALISLLASRGVDGEGYMRPAARPAPVAESISAGASSVYNSAPLDGDEDGEAPASELGTGGSAPSSAGSIEDGDEPVEVVDDVESAGDASGDAIASEAAPDGPSVGGADVEAPRAAAPKPGKARKCKSKRGKGPSVGSGLVTSSAATSEPEIISDPEPGDGGSAAEPKAVLSASDSGSDASEEADSDGDLSGQSPLSPEASDDGPAEVNSEGSLSNQGFSPQEASESGPEEVSSSGSPSNQGPSPAEASNSGSEEVSSSDSLSYKRPTSAEESSRAGEQDSTENVEPEMEGNTEELAYQRPQSDAGGSTQATPEAAGVGYKRPKSIASHNTAYETD